MSTRNILHVTATYLPATRYGGPIFAVHGLARAAVRRGHRVAVATTNVDGHLELAVPLRQPVDLEGVAIYYHRCGLGRRIYRAAAMDEFFKNQLRRFDVVHLHSIYHWPGLRAAFWARRYQVPYVISPRGTLVRAMIEKKSRWAKSVWIKYVLRDALDHAAAFHATTEHESRHIRDLGIAWPPIQVVPNGIDSTERGAEEPVPALEGLPRSRNYVGYLGRINWKKGLDRLITALSYMRNADLIIAGNDDENYALELLRLADSLGVTARIHFLGFLNTGQKNRFWRRIRCMVLPSYDENFGNVVVESLVAGCPVAVSRQVGLANEIEERRAGLVLPDEPRDLAAALDSFVTDDTLLNEMAESGGRLVRERYDWSVVIGQMEELYESVIQQRHQAPATSSMASTRS